MSKASSGGMTEWRAKGAIGIALGGLATAVAFPTQPIPMLADLALWPLIFVGLVPFLMVLLRCESIAQAAQTSLIFALGWFLIAGVWVFRVFDALGWVLIWIPIAWVVVFGISAHVVRKAGFPIWLCWPLLWVGVEFVRSEWSPLRLDLLSADLDPLNFSWFVLGHPRLVWYPAAQSADLIGGYGLSLLPFVTNLAIAGRCVRSGGLIPFRFVVGLAALEALYAVGVLRSTDDGMSVKVGVVQSERFQLPVLLGLSEQILGESPATSLIVWPELSFTAMPGDKERLQEFARVNDVTLLAGVEVAQPTGGYRNLAWWLPANGESGEYAKQLRVPFVEHHPRSIETRLFDLPVGEQSIRCGVLICYDMDFADNPRRAAEAGAAVFLIPTLDEVSWGGTQHAQHALLARLRAIENRRPIAQAATSGVSQIVSQNGEVLADIPFRLNVRPNRPTPYREGVAAHRIFSVTKVSPFTQWGYLVMRSWAAVSIMVVVVGFFRIRKCHKFEQ